MIPSRSRAFTLVEILVALAIVAVLAALLFAVFNRVRKNGYNTTCQSNLRQIFVGFQMYTQDNDSHLPPFSDWSSVIFPYANSQSIFSCPATSVHNPYHPNVDYDVYPDRVSYLTVTRSGKITHPSAHETSIVQTANWIFMTDIGSGEEGRPQPSQVMLSYPPDCVKKLTSRSPYLGREFPLIHSGGGNYLFADGHVKWLQPAVGMKTDCAAGPFLPGN